MCVFHFTMIMMTTRKMHTYSRHREREREKLGLRYIGLLLQWKIKNLRNVHDECANSNVWWQREMEEAFCVYNTHVLFMHQKKRVFFVCVCLLYISFRFHFLYVLTALCSRCQIDIAINFLLSLFLWISNIKYMLYGCTRHFTLRYVRFFCFFSHWQKCIY